MTGSTFGKLFKVSTWGESHGEALGCIIEGVPSKIKITEKFIQKFLERRKPGQSKYTTQRKEGDKVKGKIVNIMNYGVFIEIEEGIEGLVHISELADKRVAKVADVVKEGDEVSVKVIGFDRGKVKLSIKEVS